MDSSLQRKPKLKVQEKQVKPPVQRSASSRTPYSESSIHCRSITPLARLNRRVNRVLEPGRYAFKWRLLTLIVCRGRRLKHTATTTVRTRRLTLRARRSRPSTTAYLRICHEGTQRTLEEHRSHWGAVRISSFGMKPHRYTGALCGMPSVRLGTSITRLSAVLTDISPFPERGQL